jgi:hypothetical protein
MLTLGRLLLDCSSAAPGLAGSRFAGLLPAFIIIGMLVSATGLTSGRGQFAAAGGPRLVTRSRPGIAEFSFPRRLRCWRHAFLFGSILPSHTPVTATFSLPTPANLGCEGIVSKRLWLVLSLWALAALDQGKNPNATAVTLASS